MDRPSIVQEKGALAPEENNDFSAKLAQLRDDYVCRVRDELTQLVALEKQGRGELEKDGRLPQVAASEMRSIAHRLAGSAGTFGFAALGGRARVLENQLDRALTPGAKVSPAWVAVRKSLSTLQYDLQRDIANAAPASQTLNPLQERMPHQDSNQLARVAVVEDDPHVGEDLLLTLEHFGFAVSLFTSPEMAQKAILAMPPDAIVLDQHFALTPMQGTEWVRQLQQSLCSMPPVLFISSSRDFPTLYEIAEAGGRGFFSKPVDVPQLVSRLEKLLPWRQAEPYRVLIVDDDRPLSERFKLLLERQGMVAETLDQPTRLLDELHRFRPDLVLMDLYLPGYSGVTLARLVRLQQEWCSLPIVYLSAETDLDRQLEAMDIGADDFIAKPIADNHFVASVGVRVRRARELNDLLRQDRMTGLLNHALIKEELGHELTRATREKTALAVVMLDIDRFKGINDRYGHATGDLVICALANLLRQRLRRTDRIGRYGGEEFMAVLPGCGLAQVQSVIDQVREHFQAIPFVSDEGEFFVTLSAGVAAIEADGRGHSGDQLLAAADGALYQAKNTGRNRVVLAATLPG
ncbi:MAG: diguanylate cyclase [Halomonadaceae bacterium]|nr:MAG: diguanylate cyclase [Halomonadaceae bacterium]